MCHFPLVWLWFELFVRQTSWHHKKDQSSLKCTAKPPGSHSERYRALILWRRRVPFLWFVLFFWLLFIFIYKALSLYKVKTVTKSQKKLTWNNWHRSIIIWTVSSKEKKNSLSHSVETREGEMTDKAIKDKMNKSPKIRAFTLPPVRKAFGRLWEKILKWSQLLQPKGRGKKKAGTRVHHTHNELLMQYEVLHVGDV